MNKYVNLHRLEYLVTYRCSSKCRHCLITADHSGLPRHIDTGIAVRILRETGREYSLRSVMTFGGEPLLYPETVCAIHEEAKALKIPSRQVITNGYWTKDERKTRVIAQALADSGVNKVSISVDAFHQEYVPLERVKHSARSLLDAGIGEVKWNPCWLVSEQDANDFNLKTKAVLAELQKELPIEVGSGNVMEPKGRVLDNFAGYFKPMFDWPVASCQDMPYMNKLDNLQSLCVEPNGDIPVCGVILGNAANAAMNEILAGYNPYKHSHMKLILEEGIQGIIRKVHSLGLEFRKDGYYSICDLCASLRDKIMGAGDREEEEEGK